MKHLIWPKNEFQVYSILGAPLCNPRIRSPHVLLSRFATLTLELFVILKIQIQAWTLLLLLIQLKFSIFIIQAANSFQHLSKSKSFRYVLTDLVVVY